MACPQDVAAQLEEARSRVEAAEQKSAALEASAAQAADLRSEVRFAARSGRLATGFRRECHAVEKKEVRRLAKTAKPSVERPRVSKGLFEASRSVLGDSLSCSAPKA